MFLINYKTQKMCDKAVLENDETLKYFPNCHKNKKCLVDN